MAQMPISSIFYIQWKLGPADCTIESAFLLDPSNMASKDKGEKSNKSCASLCPKD